MERLLKAQYPVLNLWALMTVLSRMAATITIIAIFVLGSWVHLQGETSVGEIVCFMGFATMLTGRHEAAMGFVRRMFFKWHCLGALLTICDTESAVLHRRIGWTTVR